MLDILKKEILPHAEEYCKSNWSEILSAMKELLSLQKQMVHDGLLSLEENVDDIENQDFRDIVRLSIDAMEREDIEDFVVANYYSNKLSGLEAYLYLICACGMLFMQGVQIHNYEDNSIKSYTNGNSYYLMRQLQSLVPYAYREAIYNEFGV